MPFTDKDGHLTKAFQKEKHDTARQLLKEIREQKLQNFSSVASRGRGISTCVEGGVTHCKH